MILILTSITDSSSASVIDWLDSYKKKWLRINSYDFEKDDVSFIYDTSSFCIVSNNEKININDVNKVWFRRFPNFSHLKLNKNNEDYLFNYKIDYFTTNEKKALSHLFINYIDDEKWLNHINYVHINKLHQLNVAQLAGLNIPESIITNSKSELKLFFESKRRIILKPLHNVFTLTIEGKPYTLFTSEVDSTLLDLLEEKFYPTYFQEYIDKKYEIRAFYLNNKFYSMALFSQNSQKTMIDFRNVDYNNINRYIPYKIPDDIEDKLTELMKKLKLNSGSIDLLHSKNNKYYFLEVNPVGQFGFLSYPCNYYIEKEIAKYLINE